MGITETPLDAGTPAAELAAARLPPPPEALPAPALFLDLDGVLAPLAATPDAVLPDARRSSVLRALAARLDGRVAIVSGRPLAEIDRIADRAVTSASGVHGLERRKADGRRVEAVPHAGVKEAVAAFRAFAAARPGLIVEDKTVAAGLHYRGDPRHAEAAEALARDLAARTGLKLQPGKLVLELKTPGADKGTALAAFMAEPPFAGGVPVMVGDDLTDEYGFAAAEALGGFGVLVGAPRPTAARHGLEDVAAVLDWLEKVHAA
ncbi:MAG: trehalose-phosphatase [Alphaproteobacteria bacterium]|nr:trehalose-phosphatase [Alphaproteobacteria bacterium]MBU1526532.1 trehalose-phosphatase [Alphaproteobacteria bacterium]MBU2350095.1 trehalose-phosphatase [Alphaproteobacteria bacterium]MBU2381233.1 trehalose-phosphatase [Alphaproteobacteria bacterium]